MASTIPLNDLIEALAGAVIEAQNRIEQHQINNLLNYFDKHHRPKSLMVRLPSVNPQCEAGSEDLYRAPLLPLVSANLLKIKDVEVSFDADLGQMTAAEVAADEANETADSGKSILVDVAGGTSSKRGSVHVVLRVEGAEQTDGASRLIGHLAQTQGVYKTEKPE